MDLITALNLAMEGKDEGYTFLYEQTYQKNFAIAKGIVHNEQIAMDVLQDSYIKAFKSLKQLDNASKFEAWLGKIVRHKALDRYNSEKTRNGHQILFTDASNEEGGDYSDTFEEDRVANLPEVSIDKQETSRLVNEMISTLSDEQRICILMFYMEEMSVKEIAEELGVSENTVKSRLNYGRNKIKDKVLELEKKGTKLYGILPFTFFLVLFKKDAMACEAPMAVQGVLAAVSSTSKSAAVASAATAKSSATVAGATVSSKVIIGTVAGVVAAGAIATGAVVAVNHLNNDVQEEAIVEEVDLPDWAQDYVYMDEQDQIAVVESDYFDAPIIFEVRYVNDGQDKQYRIWFTDSAFNECVYSDSAEEDDHLYMRKYGDLLCFAGRDDDSNPNNSALEILTVDNNKASFNENVKCSYYGELPNPFTYDYRSGVARTVDLRDVSPEDENTYLTIIKDVAENDLSSWTDLMSTLIFSNNIQDAVANMQENTSRFNSAVNSSATSLVVENINGLLDGTTGYFEDDEEAEAAAVAASGYAGKYSVKAGIDFWLQMTINEDGTGTYEYGDDNGKIVSAGEGKYTFISNYGGKESFSCVLKYENGEYVATVTNLEWAEDVNDIPVDRK